MALLSYRIPLNDRDRDARTLLWTLRTSLKIATHRCGLLVDSVYLSDRRARLATANK